jgi:hypothetical protein
MISPLRVTHDSAHENKRAYNDLSRMQARDPKNHPQATPRDERAKKNLWRNRDNLSLSKPKNQCVESKSCLWICPQRLRHSDFATSRSRSCRASRPLRRESARVFFDSAARTSAGDIKKKTCDQAHRG